MTPGARVQAAIICLDAILAGGPAEQVLTTWGRQNRFAGSGDRAAIRDHVYGALRRRRSAGWIGGGDTGRALMIGALTLDGIAPGSLFTGQGHAPAPLLPDEGRGEFAAAPPAVAADLADWLWSILVADHGEAATDIAAALRHRAPVWLRANLLRGSVAAAVASLARDGITTAPHPDPDLDTALQVIANPGKVAQSQAYRDGLVELQDASSQRAVMRLPLVPDARVLDYCAGGGGKALAIAARTGGPVDAHDADPRRMADIPARAARAGADIHVTLRPAGAYDLVVVDAPCSGSGTWRRTPHERWRLTPARLGDLVALQADIVARAASLVRPGGHLAYMTCSVFTAETGARPPGNGWSDVDSQIMLPDDGGDGFSLAVFRRD